MFEDYAWLACGSMRLKPAQSLFSSLSSFPPCLVSAAPRLRQLRNARYFEPPAGVNVPTVRMDRYDYKFDRLFHLWREAFFQLFQSARETPADHSSGSAAALFTPPPPWPAAPCQRGGARFVLPGSVSCAQQSAPPSLQAPIRCESRHLRRQVGIGLASAADARARQALARPPTKCTRKPPCLSTSRLAAVCIAD